MPTVLICSALDLDDALRRTLIWREDMERLYARRCPEAMMMALAAHPQLVLVDRDLTGCEELVSALRENASTRRSSLAVVARGELEPAEIALIGCGANAILRLPAGPEWDRRLAKLLSVETRRELRLPLRYRLEGFLSELPAGALTLNLSVSGMLMEATASLRLGDPIVFAFRPSTEARVRGRGRVVRQPAPTQYGVEFERLEDDGASVIRGLVERAAA